MENLNDVEFGSDKSGEEAPILVAQRYLNIFRQVHIFNKAKRDEFDNELLALPQNITDFFKRMPGGRLLVEHIENVKTERGIAFVKANREDFDEGAGKTDTPSVVSGGVVQAVSGNITIDASFADALAQALANAFKQLPQSPVSSVAAPSAITADFGNAFDIIAEEIRTSRASLLDVLKETRSITDSVIASQVSISRILEGILATRDRDDTDIADLNNRIIASQASITKLLEGLYTASNKKNAEISEYLNIENRLQRFREEISGDLDISLQKMQELFRLCAQSLQDRKLIIETRSSSADTQTSVQTVGNARDVHFSDKSHSNTNVFGKVSEPKISHEDNSINPSVSTTQVSSLNTSENIVRHSVEDELLSDDNGDYSGFQDNPSEVKRKKKKKKRNRDGFFVEEHQTHMVDSQAPIKDTIIDVEHNFNTKDVVHSDDNSSHSKGGIPSFDGVIRNKAFKHEDNFDNVRLDIPPLDSDDISVNPHTETHLDKNSYSSPKENVVNDSLYEDNTQSVVSDASSRQVRDDLDFVLPEIEKEPPFTEKTQVFSNIGHISNIDSENVFDDDLDFALPEAVFSGSSDTSSEVSHSMGFEDISASSDNVLDKDDISDEFDDDLDFPLPRVTLNQNSKKTDETDFLSSNNSFSTDLSASETDQIDLTQDKTNITPSREKIEENADQQAIMHPVGNNDIYAESSSINIGEFGDVDIEEQVSQNNLAQKREQNISNLDTLMSEDISRQPNQTMLSEPQKDDIASLNNESALDDFMSESIGQQSNQTVLSEPQKDDITDVNREAALDDFMGESIGQQSNQTVLSEPQRDDITGSNSKSALDDFMGESIGQQSNQTIQSRYSAELDKIRQALTSDNIDIASIDQPIELDDYSDDENVGKDNYDDILSSVSKSTASDLSYTAVSNDSSAVASQQNAVSNSGDDDWEWEYVDENGNPISENDDQDWEWEYVDEEDDDENNSNVDGADSKLDDNKK